MNILFTGFYMDGWHGSMMHICEIAEYLTSQGHKCLCASVSITDNIKEYAATKGLSVYKASQLPLDIEYDIVWAYHFPILSYLIKLGLKYKKIHSGCLSGIALLEVPPLFVEECAFISAMSERTKEKLVEYYDLPADKIYVLKNLLPDKFISNNTPPRV